MCSHCGVRAPVAFERDERAGLGGSLVFRCKNCYEERPFHRSRPAEPDGEGTKGRKACETTRRFVHAATEVGLGFRAGGEALLVALDLPTLHASTWQRATQVAAKAHKKVNGEITRANLKKEIALTRLHEGDAALSPDGKVYISVMTDGSWQKRMGRNSLFGVGAYYGVYTNKLLFCSTRVSRCAVWEGAGPWRCRTARFLC